ncbi:MAG: TolC family protein [Planctomycetia bacterium]|nr:TolC family protein [Planctomycetia bacterium]
MTTAFTIRLGSPAVTCLTLVCLAACAAPLIAQEWPQPAAALQVAEPGVMLRADQQPPAPLAIDEAAVLPLDRPSPRTLAEFVTLAEQSHPKLRAARAAIEAARGKAVQARLYPNPLASAGSPQIAGPESQWNYYMSQDLVTAGKLRLSQQAALREVQRAEYDLIRARYDVLTEVRQSFYALLVSQRRVEIYTLLLDIAKRSYEIGNALVEAGEGTKADVLFWSIERDRAEVRLLNAAVYIETGRRQLATAIGLPRVDIGRIEADLFQKMPSFDLKDLQEAVVRANAKPRAVEADIARAQWNLERATVQPIPNINVLGGYQRQVGPAQEQGLMQVTMAVPLFDRNQGNIRSARADIASSRADLRTIELDLATQTAQTVAVYRTAQRLVEWYEQYILPKARETVQLTQQLYARGEVTFLSLLQAQRILTETELAFVEAQADRWNSAVTIASLLQLDTFPPPPDSPAAVPPPPGGPENMPARDPNQPPPFAPPLPEAVNRPEPVPLPAP